MEEIPKEYPQIKVKRKTGDERFSFREKTLNLNLRGFWQWSASDLVSNATRGVFAEYIVANALRLADGLRAGWDAFDLLTPDGVRIEVKSGAYIQTWYHKNLSKITFSIRPSKSWNAESNQLSTDLKRQAEIYVFCVLAHKDQNTIDPLNLNQWEFYILRSDILDDACPTQKTIGLSSLLKLEPFKAKYDEIAACVEKAQKNSKLPLSS